MSDSDCDSAGTAGAEAAGPRKITPSMKFSFAASVIVAIFIVWWSATSNAPLLLLLALTGGLVGWIAGMLATPYSEKEAKRFSEFGKVVSGIVTGFLLSKLGPLLDAFLLPGANGRARITEMQVAEQVLVTLASFLIAFLFVFGGRLYWSWDEEAPGLVGRDPADQQTVARIKVLVEKAG